LIFCSDITTNYYALVIKSGFTTPRKIAAYYYSFLFDYLNQNNLTASNVTIVPFETMADAIEAFNNQSLGFDTVTTLASSVSALI